MVSLAQGFVAYGDVFPLNSLHPHWLWAPETSLAWLVCTQGCTGSVECRRNCQTGAWFVWFVSVTELYMGATWKYVPKRKKVCFGANADLLQTKSLPKLYWFAIFLRKILHRFTTVGVGMGWLLYIYGPCRPAVPTHCPRNIDIYVHEYVHT
jgi:hypothetical protein